MSVTTVTKELEEEVILNSSSRSRKWCFTINNYTQDAYNALKKSFDVKGWQYNIGKEIGASGTPHLQGFVCHKEAIRFKTLKDMMPQAHLEIARGSVEANVKYTSKDGDSTGNIKIKAPLKRPFKKVEAYPWQIDLQNIMKTEPDFRTVYWIYDPKGNQGKTCFARDCCIEDSSVIMVSGKGADIKYAFAEANKKLDISTVFINLTRTTEQFVSYEAIECLKDGIFFCGKYESTQVLFNAPHVIVLANFSPKTEALSEDRWKIINI